MDLTPIQRKTLIRYRQMRERPATIGGVMARSLPRILVGVAITIVAAATLPPGVAFFVAGVGVGSVGREFVLARQALRAMPALLEVIDWDRVADRLGEPRPDGNLRSGGRPD